MLYQLSYDTKDICFKCGCKDTHFFKSGKFLGTKKCISSKKALPLQRLNDKDRNVAQLVAHYVRDVGVGRSSRLIPTEKGSQLVPLFYLFFCHLLEGLTKDVVAGIAGYSTFVLAPQEWPIVKILKMVGMTEQQSRSHVARYE